MIKSLYLRLFFLGLPGLYLAVWLSRFSYSMVNAMPYYYGMIMTAVSIFSGMLIGFVMYIPFSSFFKKNYLEMFLAEFIFLLFGHVFNWMDAGINTGWEIVYYFAGLCSIGFQFSLCSQYSNRGERNVLLGAFLLGSVLSYFIGVKYFEQSHIDIYLGISVFVILFLNQIFFAQQRTGRKTAGILLLMLIAVVMSAATCWLECRKSAELALLGYTEIVRKNDTIDIIDHKNRVIKDIKGQSLKNIPDILVYQLQTNQKQMDVLFIGYPGSVIPVYFFRSPFVKKLDTYFWEIYTPKGFMHATVGADAFYRSQWNFFKLFRERKYDLIVIENMPEESFSSRRIFLYYAKNILKSPHGVIAYPEILARKYDGTYLKVNPNSSLVMLNGSESTDKSEILEKRYSEFIRDTIGVHSSRLSKKNIPQKLITEFNSENSFVPQVDIEIQTIMPPKVMQILLWIFIGFYFIFRLFKCRYKNNQNNFFAFEAGFTFSIIIFSCLMLLSELRLVYPGFSPALFGISLLVLLPLNGKKLNYILQTALFLSLLYLTSINIVRTFRPIYVLPILLPMAFLGIAGILADCRTTVRNRINMSLQISFFSGIILTLLLLIFAKNNNLYPSLVYAAIISRLIYFFKI